MDVLKARKLLKDTAINMTDAEIKRDIELATLLKDVFFEINTSKYKMTQLCHNNSNVD